MSSRRIILQCYAGTQFGDQISHSPVKKVHLLQGPPLWAHRAGVRPRARRQLCTHHARRLATSPASLKLHKKCCFGSQFRRFTRPYTSCIDFASFNQRFAKEFQRGGRPISVGGPRAKQCPRDSGLAVLLQESMWLNPPLFHRFPVTLAGALLLRGAKGIRA